MLTFLIVVYSVVTLIAETSSEEVVVQQETYQPPPLFSFDKGGVGVNFLGFHARAGLGGLLTGNAADGGLHASAGTPFGQQAGAGIAGSVDGRSAGNLYAGATAGNGVAAGAGLGGNVVDGGVGFAGASAGGESHVAKLVHKSKVHIDLGKEHVHDSNVGATGSVEGGYGAGFQVGGHIDAAPVLVDKEPKYVEKTIRVPTYVEKTIKVPAYVEKTVKVPVEEPIVVEKVKIRNRPHHKSRLQIRKEVRFGGGNDYAGTVNEGYGGGEGTVVAGGHAGFSGGGNGQFFNDIFNIPISALGAVNKFLNNLGSNVRAEGGVSVHKTYSTTK